MYFTSLVSLFEENITNGLSKFNPTKYATKTIIIPTQAIITYVFVFIFTIISYFLEISLAMIIDMQKNNTVKHHKK